MRDRSSRAREAILIAATIACAIAVGVLVWGEYHDSMRVRFLAKPLASLAFIVVGVLALASSDASGDWRHYQYAIVVGLVLGAIGDVALMFGRGFLAGLVAFLFGHVAYCVAFAQLVPPRAWIGEAGVFAAAPAAVALAALAYMWPHLGAPEQRDEQRAEPRGEQRAEARGEHHREPRGGHGSEPRGGSMRGPVVTYVLVIVTMVIAAIAVARTSGSAEGAATAASGVRHLGDSGWDAVPHRAAQLIAIGACVFFASDLAVAREKFVKRSFVNRAWGLPAYYAAQLVLAWSLLGG